jgi:hypothetical protein
MRMRLFVLAAAVLLLAGCGMEADTVGPVAASSEAVETTTSQPSDVPPPQIVFVSAAGKQVAILGSYCVTAPNAGVCADSGPIHPQEVSVLQSADQLSFLLTDGSFDGPASIVVRPLGCDREEVASAKTSGAEALALDLPPGAYQADVFARFRDGVGQSTGDVTGTVGILIDPSATHPAIRPAPSGLSDC